MEKGEEVGIEVVGDQLQRVTGPTVRCSRCNWSGSVKREDGPLVGLCPRCGSARLEYCEGQVEIRGQNPKHPNGVTPMVKYRSPFGSAMGLFTSSPDFLVTQSTLGQGIWPIISLHRFTNIPHLAMVYNSMLKRFWRKRRAGIPLPKWYSHLKDIGLYSEFQKRIARRFLPNANIHLLPPVVDDFPLGRERTEKPTLLYFGSYRKKSGSNLLLEAAKRLEKERPDLKFILAIRRQIQLEEARLKIRELGLANVELRGKIDVWEALSKAWVFLYPYQGKDPPSIPLSIVEAIKSQTPIVAVNAGAIPEFLPPENLFDSTLADFLRKIRQQLDDPNVPPCPRNLELDEAITTHLELYHEIEDTF